MLILSGEEVRRLAPFPQLIDCLQEAFRAQHIAPKRQVVQLPGGEGGRLLLFMPAFDQRGAGAIKLSMVCPGNQKHGLPTIQAAIVVFSEHGAPAAILDGTAITRLRTAAASALASRYLSRQDAAELVIIGTGALTAFMAVAHCAERPIRRVTICGRSPERASEAVARARELVSANIDIRASSAIEQAVGAADIVSCVTSSRTPVLQGRWLRPGAFVDLVGSFSPTAREADDEVVQRARLFVDTLEGAMEEAGDLLDPLARRVIERQQIEGELADLVCGRVAGRMNAEEITLFKSVGTAIEDLAASQFVLAAATRGSGT